MGSYAGLSPMWVVRFRMKRDHFQKVQVEYELDATVASRAQVLLDGLPRCRVEPEPPRLMCPPLYPAMVASSLGRPKVEGLQNTTPAKKKSISGTLFPEEELNFRHAKIHSGTRRSPPVGKYEMDPTTIHIKKLIYPG